MERISRHQMFMEMAEVAAKRSTCFRGNVGAILVQENNIISMGYNGPPSGEPHCMGNDCPLSDTGGCCRSTHAEANAVRRVSYMAVSNAILYCTHSPCLDCATLISRQPINEVYYRNKYRLTGGIMMLLDSHIKVYRITKSGYIIDEKTNKLSVKP